MSTIDLEALTTDYLDAFTRRDMDACLQFYSGSATIEFAMGVYKGIQAITEWHRDRFNADLRVLNVDSIRANGDTVVLDVVGTSKLARAWRFDSIPGRVTLTFEHGKISGAKFGLRPGFSLDRW